MEQLQADLVISEQLRAAIEAERDQAQAARREGAASHQVEHDRLVAALERAREVSEAAAATLRPRPQPRSFGDPEEFRIHLERWLAEAQARLAANQGLCHWLAYEIKSAGEAAASLDREPTPISSDPSEESAASHQPASVVDVIHGPGSHGD